MRKILKSFFRNHWRILAIAAILCCVTWPSSILAAPLITGVTGTVADGQQVNISGAGFGALGPTVVMYDDFELGTDGSNVSDRTRNARVGTWRDVSDKIGPYYPTYSNLQAHSGKLSLRQNWGSGGDNQEGARWAAPTISSPSSRFFISFWTFLPSGQNVPGQMISSPNWKLYWLSTNDVFQNDYGAGLGDNNLPSEIYPVSWINGSQNRAQVGYTSMPFTKGRWARFDVSIVGSQSSGNVTAWYVDAATPWYRVGSQNGRTLDDGTTGWGYLHFPGYGRYDTNSNTYYDDIYVATGPGALARVEMGNNPIYSSCTNLSIITPSSWSNSSITATVRKGAFPAGSAAYLFVVDSAGEASTGFPVTIGSGGSQPASILPPAGLRVINGS